mgnify:CR=1 FL=1
MSYYQQRNRRRLTIGEDGNALIALIAVNLTAFVLLAFIKVIYYFTDGNLVNYNNDILRWVTLPAHLPTLATRPWTLFTNVIAHDSVWHLISNMLWLWAFGYILQDLSGNRKIVPIFIYGALAGCLMYLLAYNTLPAFRNSVPGSSLLGASGGVMAIAVATTALAPGYRIFPMINGGIPLWIITAVYVLIDVATIPVSNPGGHIAHLAGAATGFLIITQLRRGRDWTQPINQFFDWVNDLFNPDKPKQRKPVKKQFFYKTTVPPFRKNINVTQQRIDEILDKIHQRGYHSLTEDEREVLKRASKEDL